MLSFYSKQFTSHPIFIIIFFLETQPVKCNKYDTDIEFSATNSRVSYNVNVKHASGEIGLKKSNSTILRFVSISAYRKITTVTSTNRLTIQTNEWYTSTTTFALICIKSFHTQKNMHRT